MPALVRFVPSVSPDVLLEVRELRELSLTNLTPGEKNKKLLRNLPKGMHILMKIADAYLYGLMPMCILVCCDK